jgi:aspartokinase-like uncharacterized kinase
MWVVKLGGSLIFSPELSPWISALTVPGNAPLVVVPGGGPFADEVRRVQQARRFDDATAHRMAVLATEQYGLLLCAFSDRLVPAATASEIRAAQRAGHVPIWMAGAMTRDATDIEACWDVSSDSLAAWLAVKLAASALILIKSAQPPERAITAGELSRSGLVDPVFPGMVRGAAFAIRCLGPGGQPEFARALADGTLPGVAIAPE